MAIGRYGPLRSEDGRRQVVVQAVRPLKDDMLVGRLEGVASREAAAALTGTRLVIDRGALPAADEDEFYHADLIGLAALDQEGVALGEVVGVLAYGAGDILEIRPLAGDSLMVPFTKAFVPVVDLPNRRVVVAPGALGTPDEAEGEPGPDEPPAGAR